MFRSGPWGFRGNGKEPTPTASDRPSPTGGSPWVNTHPAQPDLNMSCPALPCPAWPCPTHHAPPCLALPCPTLPALPCHGWPLLSSPGLSSPCLPLLCLVLPHFIPWQQQQQQKRSLEEELSAVGCPFGEKGWAAGSWWPRSSRVGLGACLPLPSVPRSPGDCHHLLDAQILLRLGPDLASSLLGPWCSTGHSHSGSQVSHPASCSCPALPCAVSDAWGGG